MTRFSLRDVFWLTLVVGLALAWQLDQKRRDATDRELRAPAIEAECTVQTDDRRGKEERDQRGVEVFDTVARTVEADDEQNRGEQPRQLGAELEQRRAGNVLANSAKQLLVDP